MKHDRFVRVAADLARPQDRCVTRDQLLNAGASDSEIDSLRLRGFLVDVFPGIYLVGVPDLSPREFLRACVLHAGPEAWPSHPSGLELRGVLDVIEGRAVVTTKRQNVTTPQTTLTLLTNGEPGVLHVRESTPTLPLPVEWVGGFETTLLPRTLVDAAGMDGASVLRKAWRDASFKSLIDPDEVEAQLRAHRRPGNTLVRERMKNAYPVTRPGIAVKSKGGELRFLELVRELGLPQPLVNYWMQVNGRWYQLDFYWPEIRLAIETDGKQHKLEERQREDEERRMDFFIAEIDVLHIRNAQLDSNWGWCLHSVRAAYERQLRRAA